MIDKFPELCAILLDRSVLTVTDDTYMPGTSRRIQLRDDFKVFWFLSSNQKNKKTAIHILFSPITNDF